MTEYQIQEPDSAEPPEGVRDAMDFLATATLP